MALSAVLRGRPDLLLPPVDLIGTTYTGEAEDIRGRTLVRYEDEPLAAKALAMLRLAVEQCPEDEAGGTAQVYTGPSSATPATGAFTITHRYRGEQGFDTGLEVIDAVRVGDLAPAELGVRRGRRFRRRRSRRASGKSPTRATPCCRDLCEYAVPACAVREPRLT